MRPEKGRWDQALPSPVLVRYRTTGKLPLNTVQTDGAVRIFISLDSGVAGGIAALGRVNYDIINLR